VWRTHAARQACNRCTTRQAHKLRQKGFTFGSFICALSGGCVGKGNPTGRRLRPCAHTSSTQRDSIAPLWASLKSTPPGLPGATPVSAAPRR
jgi:hypothetical protein